MTRRSTAVVFVFAALFAGAAGASQGSAGTGESRAESEERTLPGGAVVRFAPGSRYTLGRPIKVQLGASPERTLAQSLSLMSGHVTVELPATSRPTSAVFIQTPYNVSAIAKGGRSSVAVGETRTTVAALSAEMLVATGNDWRAMSAGTIRDYDRGAAAAERGQLPAPQTILSAPILLKLGGAPSEVTARTSAVSGAQSYELSLWRAGKELLRRVRSQDGQFTFTALEPGSYELSSRALEASGIEGAESARALLRVVGAVPPSGARFIKDGVRMPRSQHVRLIGIDGVELAYGGSSEFIPATDTVGLVRGELTLVRFRAQGSKQELSLLLAPRPLYAAVKIGPTRARWPHDSITVAVRLTDADGQPLQDDVRLDAKVSVNLKPVSMQWNREKNALRGIVPRVEEAGPWVVRVEVTDEDGTPIAHDFLEIAK